MKLYSAAPKARMQFSAGAARRIDRRSTKYPRTQCAAENINPRASRAAENT